MVVNAPEDISKAATRPRIPLVSNADALNEQVWRQHTACDRQLQEQCHNLAPE
jgi:hypothetical protein